MRIAKNKTLIYEDRALKYGDCGVEIKWYKNRILEKCRQNKDNEQ